MLRRRSKAKFITNKCVNIGIICLGGYISKIESDSCWKLSRPCLLNCHAIIEIGSLLCGKKDKMSLTLFVRCVQKAEIPLVLQFASGYFDGRMVAV